MLVEEQTQMTRRRIDYMPLEGIEQRAYAFDELLVAPYAQQIGIRLDYMQMCVHRLAVVAVLGRQTHILYGLPVARSRLDIASAAAVAAAGLDVVVERHGISQRLPIARGADIFAQPVEGEAEGIELLAGVERPPLGVERPVYAAELRVVEAVYQIPFGARRGREVILATRYAVCGRKGPQYAGVEYRAFGCVGIDSAVAADAAVEAAPLAVDHSVEPEREYVVLQYGEHLRL